MKISSTVSLALLAALVLAPSCSSESAADTNARQPRAKAVRAPRTLDQDPTQKVPTPIELTQDGPRIQFEELEKDFGKVPDTVNLEWKFKFTNTGTDTLIIQDVKPSCGCTTIALERSSYAPGESGEIDTVWEPKGHGRQSKTITVRTNSRPRPIHQLRISAEIEPFLRVEPPRGEFKLVKRGENPEMLFTVSCIDLELEILEVKGSTPDLQVELVAPAENGQAQVRVKIAEMRKTNGVRRFFPKVLITARARVGGKGSPLEHTHSIPIIATLYDELAPEPAFFGLGRIAPGRTLTKEIVLTRPAGAPFTITDYELVDAAPAQGMTVQITPLPAGGVQGYKIALTCAPGSYEGPLRGRLVLQTDIRSEKTLRLDLFGVAGAPKPK